MMDRILVFRPAQIGQPPSGVVQMSGGCLHTFRPYAADGTLVLEDRCASVDFPDRGAVKEPEQVYVHTQEKRLGGGVEWALCSKVEAPGAVRHLPMVRFMNKAPGEVLVVALLRPIVAEGLGHQLGRIRVLESGTGYHLYAEGGLKKDEWSSWMGHLLLASIRILSDQGGQAVRPDEAWIARSLARGYASLRWSGQHKPAPRLIAKETEVR